MPEMRNTVSQASIQPYRNGESCRVILGRVMWTSQAFERAVLVILEPTDITNFHDSWVVAVHERFTAVRAASRVIEGSSRTERVCPISHVREVIAQVFEGSLEHRIALASDAFLEVPERIRELVRDIEQ